MIKAVGVSPAGTGLGMFVCGFLGLLFGYAWIYSLFSYRAQGNATLMGFLLTLLCAYGVYASYRAANTIQVWLKTGVMPVFVFKSMDTSEAQKVKTALEQAISKHRPISAADVNGG